MSKDVEKFLESSLSLSAYTSQDAKMRKCLELAEVATRTDLPVLILGESGTGKTLLAKAIHCSSKRRDAPFVSFNAAALSDSLLDSQLFGHERGAFTHADRRVRGKFELADTGTLFIDEIADMSSGAQVKILRVVEYGEFERLGSEELQKVDVRLIAATHLSLERFIEEQKFRKDLFYRLSGITIRLPALRERPNDLRALVASEIEKAALKEGKLIKGLTKTAADKLFSHQWPGNLRELSRVVQTAVALCERDIIDEEQVLFSAEFNAAQQAIGNNGSSAHNSAIAAGPAAVNEQLNDLSLQTAEIRHILKVLELMAGNKRKTARVLGVSRSTLDRKLDR